jgi:hypothetical protein
VRREHRARLAARALGLRLAGARQPREAVGVGGDDCGDARLHGRSA